MEIPRAASDRLLDALERIQEGAAENVARSREIQRRAGKLRTSIMRGTPVADAIEAEPRPRTVELLTANMAILETAGAELRAAQAHALRAEGLTLDEIAELFNVTRQRISALLKQHTGQPLK